MKLLKYSDLFEMGVFGSRMSLKRGIDEQSFPPGKLVTPNARRWTEEEVLEWLANRPVARKDAPPRKSAARVSAEAVA
jgi:hypothetical protein